ncbi:UNVERIFIED_CONTAM: hypothetical protein GTU68_018602 [Idotea baltica]|nr:hypothetical protein [Idotea baltica]
MKWDRHCTTWPLSETSRFVRCRPHHWHIQEQGTGPGLLLLHGAGGSTHSFRALIPRLSEHFHVSAFDLPGQGFTRLGTKQRSSLATMAEDIAALCAQENWMPEAIIGHSAGAALALQLCRILPKPPERIVGINPALANYGGATNQIFSGLAKVLAANPLTAGLFSLTGSSRKAVTRMISGTGSQLDDAGLEYYQRLVSDRRHVDGTLAMMAHWNLNELRQALPEVKAHTLFITAAGDKAVPPKTAQDAAAMMPNAHVSEIKEYGHLVHEEAPGLVSEQILDFLRSS